jgi:5'(3')-deoxyribonucleotidase
MKIKSNEIGFDLDGVIADTAEAFIRLACEEHDFCSFALADITTFQVEDCLNIPVPVVEEIFNAILHDSLATGLQPMTGAVEVITRMTGAATVTIITARPLRQPVQDWLEHFFPASVCANIRLVAMGCHDDKARYIHDHKLRYFVDDRAETCLQLAETAITPFVFSQPWNQGKHDLQSVRNWQEIHALLAFDN